MKMNWIIALQTLASGILVANEDEGCWYKYKIELLSSFLTIAVRLIFNYLIINGLLEITLLAKGVSYFLKFPIYDVVRQFGSS